MLFEYGCLVSILAVFPLLFAVCCVVLVSSFGLGGTFDFVGMTLNLYFIYWACIWNVLDYSNVWLLVDSRLEALFILLKLIADVCLLRCFTCGYYWLI